MWFNEADAGIGHAPETDPNVKQVLYDSAMAFINAIPKFIGGNDEKQKNYRIDTDFANMTGPVGRAMWPQTAHPNAVLDGRQVPYSRKHTNQEAQWRLITKADAWQDDFNQNKRRPTETLESALSHLKMFFDTLAIEILQSAGPAAGEIGSFVYNLTGYTDALYTYTTGYNATVLGRQTLVGAGQVMEFDTLGGNFGSFADVVFEARKRCLRGNNLWIIPESFQKSMNNANYRSGAGVTPFNWLAPDDRFRRYLEMNGQLGSFTSIDGIPAVVVPDAIYTAAGYTVGTPGANNYPIFLVNLSSDWRQSVGLHFSPAQIPSQAVSVFDISGGIQLVDGGQILSPTGVVLGVAKTLNANVQFIVGDPSACVVIDGVID